MMIKQNQNILEKLSDILYNYEQQNLSWIKYAYIILAQIILSCLALNTKLLPHWSIQWKLLLRLWMPFVLNSIILKILHVNTYIKDNVLHKWFLLRGSIGPIGFLCYVYSIANLPMSEANMIQMTTPIWVSVLAPFYIGEQFYYSTLLMIFCCFFGLTLIMKPAFLFTQDTTTTTNNTAQQQRPDIYGNQFLGYISGLLFSFIFAGIQLLTKKLIGKLHNLMIIHGFYAVGALFAAPILLLYSDIPQFKQSDILPVIAVSLSGTLTQLFNQRSIIYNRISTVSALSYTQIILTIAIDFIYFDFIPNVFAIIGAILILVSCLTLIFFKV